MVVVIQFSMRPFDVAAIHTLYGSANIVIAGYRKLTRELRGTALVSSQ